MKFASAFIRLQMTTLRVKCCEAVSCVGGSEWLAFHHLRIVFAVGLLLMNEILKRPCHLYQLSSRLVNLSPNSPPASKNKSLMWSSIAK